MECYSEQVIALAVDGELPAEEAQRLRDHLATCQRCRNLLDALRAENRILSESLHELPEEAISPVGFSRLPRSVVWRDLAVLAAVLALGSIVVPWIDKLSIPEALQWLNPFSVNGGTNLIFNLSSYFAQGGTAMLADYAAVVGGLFLMLLLGGSVLLLGRRWRLPKLGLHLLMLVLVFSLPSSALERRHGDFVTVTANETVDDTLVATGNTVVVEGVVNGDLLVFAQTLEVRGNVKGDVVSLAKRTVVSGTVEGRIFSCSRSMELGGELGHSLYNWGQSLRIEPRAHVGEGIVAGGEINLEGEVKRSATLYGEVEVSGTVGRDLIMAGRSLTLTNTARVGGDLKARVRQTKDVHIADGASISGKRDVQLRVRKNHFTSPKFYLHQVVWLAAAMLMGWLGVALFPGFFQACTQAVGSGWRSAGLGLGVLAGTPVAIVVLAITLVGLPISLILLGVYVAGLELAKLLVGAFLGQILLKPAGFTKRDWLLGLLVGLLILTIVGFIPYLGGLVRFGVVCLGLGAFAWQLYRASRPAMTA